MKNVQFVETKRQFCPVLIGNPSFAATCTQRHAILSLLGINRHVLRPSQHVSINFFMNTSNSTLHRWTIVHTNSPYGNNMFCCKDTCNHFNWCICTTVNNMPTSASHALRAYCVVWSFADSLFTVFSEACEQISMDTYANTHSGVIFRKDSLCSTDHCQTG